MSEFNELEAHAYTARKLLASEEWTPTRLLWARLTDHLETAVKALTALQQEVDTLRAERDDARAALKIARLPLLPCPRCGGEPGTHEDMHYLRGWHFDITCYNDNCMDAEPDQRVSVFEKQSGPNYEALAYLAAIAATLPIPPK